VLSEDFASGSNWTTQAGSWSFASSTAASSTNGSILIANPTQSGHLWLQLQIKANAADQVAEILVATNSTGTTGLKAVITFGDSAVTNDCGTIQLFESGSAVDDPQPLVGLVNGAWWTVDICYDPAFKKLFATIAKIGPTKFVSASAALASGSHGSYIGVKVVTANSANIEFDNITWEKLELANTSTCRICDPCSTGFPASPHRGIATGWPTSGGDDDTCQYDVTGTQPNVSAISTVDHVISAYDREHGYGISVAGEVGVPGVASLKIDNNHHEMRLIAEVLFIDPDDGFGKRWWAVTHVELWKDGTKLAETDNAFYDLITPPGGYYSVHFNATLAMCDDRLVGGDGFGGTFGSGTSAATTRTDDGNTCSASVTGYEAQIDSFSLGRCLGCSFCSNCDDLLETRSFSVVIDVDDVTIDGTYILTGSGCSFSGGAAYLSGTVALWIYRSFVRVTVTGNSKTGTGDSDPITAPIDCEGIADLEIALAGTLTGTATVTAV